jgi:exodeoxyribonuclease VII large subunit
MLPSFSPSEFVAVLNQSFEGVYPQVEIEGEVLQFKISKNRWVYFDICDEQSKLRCFGTVYLLPTPIENGMRVKIVCAPRLHPQFGFSLTIQSLQLSGEGSIKKAADLLERKLEAEGLFAADRKRSVAYPPQTIGLITSSESAAYNDFIKVLAARFGGINISLADVQVQGESAVGQIVRAITWFNQSAAAPDVLVLIRGGGSKDDLQAFSSEQVTRAVAASRIPTVVAIGHETDISLAERAADLHASTPSNAAELLVPDRRTLLANLSHQRVTLRTGLLKMVTTSEQLLSESKQQLLEASQQFLDNTGLNYERLRRHLVSLSPEATLKRGYAVVRSNDKVVKSVQSVKPGNDLTITFVDGQIAGKVQ